MCNPRPEHIIVGDADSPLCDPTLLQLVGDRNRRGGVFSWRPSRPTVMPV